MISDSMFYFNQVGGDGGAIYCKESKIRLVKIYFKMNSAVNGGSLHLSSCPVTIEDRNDIIGNKAKFGGGFCEQI